MIRLMMMFEKPSARRRVEVVALAKDAFPDATEAELHVFSGEGGVAELPLWGGGVLEVERDDVEAICGWEEG